MTNPATPNPNDQNAPGIGTPNGQSDPGTGAPNNDEIVRLREENKKLNDQNAEKDRHITELSTEKATLEQRLTSSPSPSAPSAVVDVNDEELEKEVAEILEEGQVDPKSAAKKLTGIIKKSNDTVFQRATTDILSNLGPRIDNVNFANKLEDENKDLFELGLKPAITIRVQELINQGKDFRIAATQAVNEARARVDKIKGPTMPKPSTPPGAQGEVGNNNQQPPPPPPKEETEEEEVQDRKRRRMAAGL